MQSEYDIARQAVAAAMNSPEASEYDKAQQMREIQGIAKHGIEGWRLLTNNWETTVDILRQSLIGS